MVKKSFGFGFDYTESDHHFLVFIPRDKNSDVIIYERFNWDKSKNDQKIDLRFDRPKVKISKYKWSKIEDTVKKEFNKRLKLNKYKTGKWKIGQIPVQRLLGKELVLLTWAIEDCDPSMIPIALKNWNGLRPEERWWLFTMTNATTGNMDDKRGWRKAIRYALTENPIMEKKRQVSLFEEFYDDELKIEGE